MFSTADVQKLEAATKRFLDEVEIQREALVSLRDVVRGHAEMLARLRRVTERCMIIQKRGSWGGDGA